MIKYKDKDGVHEVDGLLWTGKTDRNGKDIFEHDILKIGRRKVGEATRDNLHIVVWQQEKCRFITASIQAFMDIEGAWTGGIYSHYEVVGNVEDNPEIIEQELKLEE